MDMDTLQEQINQYYQNAPQEVRDFFGDTSFKKSLLEISTQQNLSEDQTSTLILYTYFLVFGVILLDEYPSKLQQELGIAKTSTQKIFAEILDLIEPVKAWVDTLNIHAKSETLASNTNMIIAPELEPMIIPGEEVHDIPVPIRKPLPQVPQNLPITEVVEPKPATTVVAQDQIPQETPRIRQAPVAALQQKQATPEQVTPKQPPLPVQENKPTESVATPQEHHLDRDDILSAIENPEPILHRNTIETKETQQPTLKNPGTVATFTTKTPPPANTLPQTQKSTDPYREPIE